MFDEIGVEVESDEVEPEPALSAKPDLEPEHWPSPSPTPTRTRNRARILFPNDQVTSAPTIVVAWGPPEPPAPSPPPSPPCVDTDDKALDTYSAGCSDGYAENPQWCGSFDDSDFSSNTMSVGNPRAPVGTSHPHPTLHEPALSPSFALPCPLLIPPASPHAGAARAAEGSRRIHRPHRRTLRRHRQRRPRSRHFRRRHRLRPRCRPRRIHPRVWTRTLARLIASPTVARATW